MNRLANAKALLTQRGFRDVAEILTDLSKSVQEQATADCRCVACGREQRVVVRDAIPWKCDLHKTLLASGSEVVSASHEDKRSRSQVVDDLLRERGFYAEADELKREHKRRLGITWRDVTDYAELTRAEGTRAADDAANTITRVQHVLATTRLPWPGVKVSIAVIERGNVRLTWRCEGVGEAAYTVAGGLLAGPDADHAIRTAIQAGWRDLAMGALFGGA